MHRHKLLAAARLHYDTCVRLIVTQESHTLLDFLRGGSSGWVGHPAWFATCTQHQGHFNIYLHQCMHVEGLFMGSLHMPRSGTRYLQLRNHTMAESMMRRIHQHLACRNAGSPQAQGLVRSGGLRQECGPCVVCCMHTASRAQQPVTCHST